MENQVTNYTQLCVWPGTCLSESKEVTTKNIEDFEKHMLNEFNARVKFDSIQLTKPDICPIHGEIPDTGERSDLFFYVHSDDIPHFVLPRLQQGIRWWEDVIKYNDSSKHLYSEEFVNSKPTTW